MKGNAKLPTRVLLYGKDEPLPERIPLRAGPLTLIWEAGDLRYVRAGETEILRRIYVAIRDRNWDTAPNEMANLKIEAGEDAFHITYDVENRLGDLHFAWRGAITGGADGVIRFSMDGVARTTFMKNRIGFCILHPDDIAGAPARVHHADGSTEAATLPRPFSPDQPVQPFAEMAGIAHEVAPGLWAELRFEGDIFEMEDQRNWTDASYKTFSTPLRLPYPVEVAAGTRLTQAVTLALRDTRETLPAVAADTTHTVTFTVEPEGRRSPLPEIGLGVASHGAPLLPREIMRLRELNLAHLRVDLTLSDAGYPARLRQAAVEAATLGVGLEMALFVTPGRATAQFETLRAVLAESSAYVARWLVFAEHESFGGDAPLADILEPAAEHLGAFGPTPILSGTNADFIFLARNIPPLDLVDGLAFPINPQVHAFDNASVVETLGTQRQVVANARALAAGKPVYVSPVTLKMRHNPYATGAVPPTPPGRLPPQVDPRQMSLFLAGWTAVSIKQIATAGAAGVTYYETTGWRGVMETASSAALPDRFYSIPGGVFPVYHILADVGEFAAGGLIPGQASAPLICDGLALAREDAVRVVLTNLTGESQQVTVRGLPAVVQIRVLDASNAESAMRGPEEFRDAPTVQQTVPANGLSIELAPYAVARMDGQRADHESRPLRRETESED